MRLSHQEFAHKIRAFCVCHGQKSNLLWIHYFIPLTNITSVEKKITRLSLLPALHFLPAHITSHILPPNCWHLRTNNHLKSSNPHSFQYILLLRTIRARYFCTHQYLLPLLWRVISPIYSRTFFSLRRSLSCLFFSVHILVPHITSSLMWCVVVYIPPYLIFDSTHFILVSSLDSIAIYILYNCTPIHPDTIISVYLPPHLVHRCKHHTFLAHFLSSLCFSFSFLLKCYLRPPLAIPLSYLASDFLLLVYFFIR